MPDFVLVFRLLFKTFIFKKGSLHYPVRKRFFFVIFGFPFIAILIFWNQLFLFLDNLFFFPFRFKNVGKSAFIVGVPRSGTTYMFELLSRDKNFTCFKLWEIIFAPSIIQKLIALFIIKMDHFFGRPLFKFSKWMDNVVFGDFRDIHNLGLSLPEEDELLMIYNFSSLYFYYFFPEAKAIKPYLFFDHAIPEKKKKRIMNYYFRCVQRHQFVFNRKGDKIFLSKNPAFVSKIDSLGQVFSDCKFIYMLRSPLQTIPSTISLNEHIFQVFSKVEYSIQRIKESREIIIEWYKMSSKSLFRLSSSNYKIVLFKQFVTNPFQELKEIYKLLGINPETTPNSNQKELMENRKNFVSKHQYDIQIGLVDNDENHLLEVLGLSQFKKHI